MNREPNVLDIALSQMERMGGPTAIVPVPGEDGPAGVFCATYCGDREWMEMAQGGLPAVDVAIACCKRAHADARAHVAKLKHEDEDEAR